LPKPHITLKLATSLDGKIALANGQSEWITGEKARIEGRKLRATHDAICVGANTAVLDNPQLTSRIDNEPDPVRVIFDSHLRLSERSNLAMTARETPVWIFCKDDSGEKAKRLIELGVKLFPVEGDGPLDVMVASQVMRARGIETLLLEGGGQLAASFLKAGLIDRLEWFRAPIIIGSDGRDAIADLGLSDLARSFKYNRIGVKELGDDLLESFERA